MEHIVYAVLAAIVILMLGYWSHERSKRQQEIDRLRNEINDAQERENEERSQVFIKEMAGMGFEQQPYMSREHTHEETDSEGYPIVDRTVERDVRWVKVQPRLQISAAPLPGAEVS